MTDPSGDANAAPPEEEFPFHLLPESVRDDFKAFYYNGKRLPPPLAALLSGDMFYAVSFTEFDLYDGLQMVRWLKAYMPEGPYGDYAKLTQWCQQYGKTGFPPGTQGLK